mmetsp:Transcript_40231/g.89316  ORF Transcript_40231/g.89316 Transcript_40231/m.89316 type:complete len:262 (+) Transcript_40231:206-991(+)|eukprot:CAMPEP_0202905716 /NCGR_PEP_ID=MMETSP1392-20130828/35673_1 /ASSEMBLY_ACC=CAM_ASM_000868 /TAXON_ID=225041 /ORGANISM="Chlamydomonas chlamydogama, Strain SAG 11-48b" /LENGTH=261 /DNA_ID=CAMNT_0049593937 /DNA_START=168 /DNA_END=953 /DNA_ORIENTATION=+
MQFKKMRSQLVVLFCGLLLAARVSHGIAPNPSICPGTKEYLNPIANLNQIAFPYGNHCRHVTLLWNSTKCSAGPVGLEYAPPSPAADAKACGLACVSDMYCQAWRYTPPVRGLGGCTLIRNIAVAGRKLAGNRRKLSQDILFDTYTCSYNVFSFKNIISGEVRKAYSNGAVHNSGIVGAEPYNKDLPRHTGSDINGLSGCSIACMSQQFNPRCTGWTWNAANGRCFLYNSTGIATQPWDTVQGCDLYSFVVSQSCPLNNYN